MNNYVTESKTKYRIKSSEEDVQGSGEVSDWKDWKLQKSGSITGIAAVVDGKVYFGSCDQHVYCLDARTGKLIWKFRTGNVVTSSPLVADGVVYVGSDDNYFYALDAKDGSLIWKFLTGGSVMEAGLPAMVNGNLYITSRDNHLYCLSRGGEELWNFGVGHRITGSPSAANGNIFIGSHDKHLYCLTEDGRLVWKFLAGDSFASGSSACIIDKNNEEVWRYGMFNTQNAKMPENGVAVIAGSADNHVYCLDIETGKTKWMFITGGLNGCQPTVHDGILYFGSYDNYFYANSPDDGRMLWKVKTGDIIDCSQAAFHKGLIYFGSGDHYLYGISPEGRESWRFLTGDIILSTPVIVKDMLYIGCWDTYFYAVDLNKKEVIWKFQTGLPFATPILGVIRIAEKVTSSKFTLWKPEIMKAELIKNYEHSPASQGTGIGYKTESQYKMEGGYSMEKKKKDWRMP